MVKNYTNLLKDMPLFKNIAPDDIETMLVCLDPYAKFYKKGNYITHCGDSIDSVGVILQGAVQMLKEDVWGNTDIPALIPEKNIFGETFVISGSGSSTVSFRTAADSDILFLSFDKLLHSCTKACHFHHQLIDNMVMLIAQKNMQLMNKLEIITHKTLREKILAYLSQQAQQHNSPYFKIPLGRLELADYLGADRSALSRELSRMKADGLLDYNKSTFRLYKTME